MSENEGLLESILDRTWLDLAQAMGEPGHPWRLGQLGTVVDGLGVDIRTVVLRKVDRETRRLWFFADRRSSKILHIEADPRVAWLFYDPMLRIQLRWHGQSRIVLDGDVVERCWAGLNETQRDEYASAASPGTVLGEGWDKPETPPNRLTKEEARRWFCLIEVTVSHLDWLKLDQAGHVRAKFEWDADGQPCAAWVVP